MGKCSIPECAATRRDRCICEPGTIGSLKEKPVNPRLQTKRKTETYEKDTSAEKNSKPKTLKTENDDATEDKKEERRARTEV